jgi:hypothetical protein
LRLAISEVSRGVELVRQVNKVFWQVSCGKVQVGEEIMQVGEGEWQVGVLRSILCAVLNEEGWFEGYLGERK